MRRGRITLEPGLSWDKCVKPIVKTNSCEIGIERGVMGAYHSARIMSVKVK
jgi:hypothetical protein